MVDPKDNRQTRHAFWTNQADLDPTLRGVGEDRYNAVFGKVDLLDRLPCLDQPLAQFEGDGLKIGLEQIEIVAVQRKKKAVPGGYLLKAGHGCRGRSKIRLPGRHGSRAPNAAPGMI